MALVELTSLSADLDVTGIPFELQYDSESGEVTAFNDDLRVAAVGSTPAEAEEKFRLAVLALVVQEVEQAVGSRVRESLSRQGAENRYAVRMRPRRRSELTPA